MIQELDTKLSDNLLQHIAFLSENLDIIRFGIRIEIEKIVQPQKLLPPHNYNEQVAK